MIYIVRHGQTRMNKAGALQGRSDLPLNDNGIAQASALAQRLALKGIVFDRVYSSPLSRAVETARIVAPGVPLTCDDRLIEMDYGPYEGMDLSSPPPEVAAFFSDFANCPAPDGMEQLSSVVERTGAFIQELAEASGNTLISTHAIAMKGILEYLTPSSHGSYWSKYIGNCAVYAAEQSDAAFGIPFELDSGVGRPGV